MTTETLKNPTVDTIDEPIGIEAAIKEVQLSLAALPWLTKSFGRAWTLPTTSPAGKTVYEPKVYRGNEEYYPVLPNDALNAFSFWRVNGRSSKDWVAGMNPGSNYIFEDPCDLIVWFNMKAIDPYSNYIFKERLIRDVLNRLTRFSRITVSKVWDDKIEDIYRGYAVQEAHRDLVMYPFGAFRVEMTLGYQFACSTLPSGYLITEPGYLKL